MRIMKSKAADPTYHVIQDIKRDGKRSTEIIENLGHASEIFRKYNVSDADIGADEYINNLRNSAKAQEHKILIPFVTDSVIEKINLYHLTQATSSFFISLSQVFLLQVLPQVLYLVFCMVLSPNILLFFCRYHVLFYF